MEPDHIDIDARKLEICNQDSYEKAHDYAAKLINDLSAERERILNGICSRCEDKQHAIDALRAEADPDALTICYMQGQASVRAERDELQRRLDAVIAECCGPRDVCARTMIIIAEGRDNG